MKAQEKWTSVESSWQYTLIVGADSGDTIAELSIADDEDTAEEEGKKRDANVQRILSAYNATHAAGINPSSVPAMKRALDFFVAESDKLNPIHFDSGTQYGRFMQEMREMVNEALQAN